MIEGRHVDAMTNFLAASDFTSTWAERLRLMKLSSDAHEEALNISSQLEKV
jgi:hypothetical protein